MLGLNELITMSRHWPEWSDPRVIIIVLNNQDLNMVTWEQRVMVGDPKFPASQDLPPFSYAQFARQLGLGGITVDHPDDLGDAFDQAFAADRPTLIDAIVDPDVPPLPPHISFEQARSYLSAILEGDPDAAGIVKQSYTQILRSWLPQTARWSMMSR